MSKSTQFLTLITKLKPNEKGYLKKYYLYKEGTFNKAMLNCLVEAETLLAKKVDIITIETALKKKFGNNKAYSYSKIKGRLIETITNALLDYHSSGDAEYKVMQYLGKIKLLMERNDYELAKSFLQKAKKIANENGLTYLANRCELLTVQIAADNYVNGPEMDQLIDSLNDSNRALFYGGELQALNVRCWNLRQNIAAFKSSNSELGFNKAKVKLNKELLALPIEQLLPIEHIKYYQVKRQILLMPDTQIEECCTCSEEILSIFNNHPSLKSSNVNKYVGSAILYLHDVIYSQQWSKYANALAIAQKSLSDFKGKVSRGHNRYYNLIYLQLLYCRLKDDYQSINEIAKNFNNSLKEHQPQPEWYWGINFSLAHCYFAIGKYSESLNYLLESKKVIHEPNFDIARTMSTRILEIVLHYELKNFDVLPHLVRSFYRFLKSKNHLLSLEKELIYIFKALAKVNNDKAFKALLKSQLEKLKLLEDDVENDPLLASFDFIAYVNSIVTNRSYREVFAAKILQEQGH